MDLDKDSLNLDLKDEDSASVDTLTVGIDSIAQDCDFSELVDSIYNDKIHLFSSKILLCMLYVIVKISYNKLYKYLSKIC